jgi:dTDP-4-dehydrorhamnose 3,5-epimerase
MIHYNHPTFEDNRGSYTPISTSVIDIKWDQCSISINEKPFTFRGMHYQVSPRQTKYVKVIKGSIIDFAYDMKSKELKHMKLGINDAVLIEKNLVHGFLTLEPDTIVTYMVKGAYNPSQEKSIPWNAIPELHKIISNLVKEEQLVISEKDKEGK